MSISERLQMVIKMNGMTNASFADEIGVQRSSISHVLAGRNKPSIDFIQKILTTFPKVNADWLITGKKIGRTAESEEKKEEAAFNSPHESASQLEPTIREEEPRGYNNDSASTTYDNSLIKNKNVRKIKKIIVFYNDGTFEETVPKH
jgi:transcriptional regulator with XRE-family HTH domain